MNLKEAIFELIRFIINQILALVLAKKRVILSYEVW